MTESIHPGGGRYFRETGALYLTLLTNDATLAEGQEVILSDDNEVAKRTAADKFPIGVVEVAPTHGKVTVRSVFSGDCAVVINGTANPGDFIRPDGTVVNGKPQYVPATTGSFAMAVLIGAGRAGILRSPIKV